MFCQTFLQFLRVNVAFEGHLELSVFGLVNGAVNGCGLAALDVTLGGVEVAVAGYIVALMHQSGEEHILGCASLMGRDNIVETGEAVDGLFELEPAACAGIALVAKHQGCPLTVAHCACA